MTGMRNCFNPEIKRLILAVAVFGILCVDGIAQIAGGASSNTSTAQGANAKIAYVRVVISTRGISVSNSIVKPGSTRFIVENRTPLRNPEVQITPVAGPGIQAAAGTPALSKFTASSRRVFQDVTLSPGSYVVWLTAIPEQQISLEVQP